MKAKTIKKYSFAMASAMFLTNAMPLFTFATIENSIGSINTSDDGVSIGVDTTQSQKTEYYDEFTSDTTQNTTVYVSQASSFGVIIPKTIILDGKTKNATYEVSVMGNIGGDENVSVIPEDTFLMKQLGKKDIDAIVSQDKTTWAYNEFTTKGNGSIVAENMSAGSWEGQFNFEIKLDSNENSQPKVVVVDENGNDLNAKMSYITGNEKETLLNELVESGNIANTNEISTLINVTTDDFENKATATFDVGDIAKVGDKVAIYHYDETTSEWEYIATCEVDENGKITANFDSFSPIALKVMGENHISHDYKLVETIDSTCTKEGYSLFKCVCGEEYKEIIEQKEHTTTEEEIIKYPTCTEKGLVKYSCDCGYSYEEEIENLGGHILNNGVCTRKIQNENDEQIQCTYLDAGLYDANGTKIVSWDDLTNKYGLLDITKETPANNNYSLCGILNNNSELAAATRVVLPNGIETIGDNAFSLCENITSIVIPEGVHTIGVCAFEYCTSVTSITLPSTLQTIGDFAFSGCLELENLELPDSVTSIGAGAFESCLKIKTINLSENLTSLGVWAFYECSGLEEITIPSNITTIGESTFENCYALKKVTFNGAITEIEVGAFAYCIELDIEIPNTVTSIGEEAFIEVKHITYNGTASGSPWGANSIN